ncbi:MAG: hypothetical protein Q4D57_06700, partial [Clostridia bacterium]|nr:hypothetical protein [Clostridia bacterium]
MGLKDYFLTSSKTRSAKKKLETIDKQNLEKFLKKDFDKEVTSVSNVDQVFNFVRPDGKANVGQFAKELEDVSKLKNFVDAIKDQAKSVGTKSEGLFRRLIYTPLQNLSDEESIKGFFGDDGNIEKLKKNIKLFLLAKKDKEIEGEEFDEEDKKIRRKHNASVIEKLKSKRLS